MKTAIEVEKKLKELRLNREENKEKIEILNWVFYPYTPLLTNEIVTMYLLSMSGKSDNEIGKLFGIRREMVRKYLSQLARSIRKVKRTIGIEDEEPEIKIWTR